MIEQTVLQHNCFHLNGYTDFGVSFTDLKELRAIKMYNS